MHFYVNIKKQIGFAIQKQLKEGNHHQLVVAWLHRREAKATTSL
jgi:hypothetical protein